MSFLLPMADGLPQCRGALRPTKKVMVAPSPTTAAMGVEDEKEVRIGKKKEPDKPDATVKNNRQSAIHEVTMEIKEYFNVMLGAQLLYKFEQDQHAVLLSEDPNMVPAWVYGTVHLLRLFVKLGGMLTYTRLGEKSVQFLLFYINNFMNYLKKNASVQHPIHH